MTAEVNGVAYRLLFALEMGIFITAGTLPLEYLIPTTFQTVLILAVIALLSVGLIDVMYKKRGDE